MLKKSILVIFLLIFFSSLVFAETAPKLNDLEQSWINDFAVNAELQNYDSNGLNTLGFKAYEEGNILKAAKLWWCALQKNDKNSWANYNFACALSLIAEGFGRDPSKIIYILEYGDPETDALVEYTEKIFDHLKQAVVLDKQILQRMQEDSDLDLIRNMDAYKFMLLYPDNPPEKLLRIIGRWYAGNMGVFPGGSVTFEDGSITIISPDFTDSGDFFETMKRGYFTMDGNMLNITIEDPEKEQFKGELKIRYDAYGFILSYYLIVGGTTYSSEPDYSA
ncbi:MAG: hypothetical protein E4H36_05295 [Spirochaetales bacterium]|nr:MAG: hypothetical protein E4H36_05295 [Spirochaetales bacterium]